MHSRTLMMESVGKHAFITILASIDECYSKTQEDLLLGNLEQLRRKLSLNGVYTTNASGLAHPHGLGVPS